MKSLQKIAIIGISGVGKSWTASYIGKKTNIPIVHMDQVWWEPYWKERPESVVQMDLLKKLQTASWVIEGYIQPLGVERLQQADLVIYLDFSGWQSLFGGLQRWFRHKKKKRPEMPEGCTDKLNFNYLKTMFLRAERAEIENVIKKSGISLVRLRSRSQLHKYLAQNF